VVLKVPIEFRNVPDKLEIDSASFTEAQIRVRGPERLVNRLRSTDVSAHVDLSRVVPGTRTFELTSNVNVPNGLDVVQVDPTQFQLSFDYRMTRRVDVRPRVIGSFAPGMRVAQALADPPSVMISGPRSRVEKVEAATTDPVDATGTMERASFVSHAYVPEPLVYVVQPAPVRVTVIMEHSGEEKAAH
jgi:YbbR domain-containing protein